MKICLTIKDRGASRSYEISVGKSSRLPTLAAFSSSKVSARIVVETETERGFYILRIPSPDISAFVVAKTSGSFEFKNENRDGRHDCLVPEFEFLLLRGGMGGTYLELLKYQDGKFVEEFKIAEVEVLLGADDPRGRYYDWMTKDLLQHSLPHFVIDDFRWQMAKNRFSLGWKDGYVSAEKPDVMLLMIGRILKKMKPLVLRMNEAAQMRFEKVFRWRPVSLVSRAGGRTLRDLSLLMNRNGVSSVDEIVDGEVREGCRQATCNTHAHSVVLTFLRSFIKPRLLIISESLQRRIDEQRVKIANLKDMTQPSTRNINAEAQSMMQSLNRKTALLVRLDATVNGLMMLPVFSEIQEELSVFDVQAGEFEATEVYRRLYLLILEYSRSSFWWIEDRVDSMRRIPKVELSEDGESRLQMKYSTVYENWCYSRIVMSLLELGYRLVEGGRLDVVEGSSVVFSNDTTEVTVCHGILALRKGKRKSTDFVCTGQRKKMTPDFAFLFRDLSTGSESWVVADAKSDSRLREHMVKTRNDYALIKWHDKEPIASVLFRSGEDDGPCSGFEFPPPLLRSAHENLKDEYDDHAEDDYVWKEGYGIEEGEDCLPPYHGHVRVNVQTLEGENDVFKRFISGMIQTAARISVVQ